MSNKQVEAFFKILLGPHTEGYICIATLEAGSERFQEKFFAWPKQMHDMLTFIDKVTPTHNVYFCPQLLRAPRRIKDNVKICTNAWADLDECAPENMLVEPSVIVESSPLRFQAYWVFEEDQLPEEVESITKRLAYYHAFQGADRSGWDLSQLLRVPGTLNLKPHYQGAQVRLLEINRNKYRLDDFSKYPKVIVEQHEKFPFPRDLADVTGEQLLDRYEDILPPQARYQFETTPDGSWNEPLWKLMMVCFEAELTREETFVIARDSACNKYKRDNKPMTYLWADVCRSWSRHQENRKLLNPESTRKQIPMLSQEEESQVSGVTTFVEEYIEWASSLGDAAPQYHQAGALILLSSLLSGMVRLPTSFGTIKPNLWFMILADTTLTRKSTAMDVAMDLIEEIDSARILATDGSIEGLMGSLSTRPGQPSIFLRDEFSGLLEAMVKKDYYAGMAETFTKLYDGKLQKRILKKEVIEVKDPCLILFAGGIRNKVCGLLTSEHVSSGFIPRFVFITAESDVARVRPLGPPSGQNIAARNRMLERLRNLANHYKDEPDMRQVGGQFVYHQPEPWAAALTPEAWRRYNELEAMMMDAGLKSPHPDIYTPTYDRLCKSILKAAILIAASRKLLPAGKEIKVELNDLLLAIRYGQQWRTYTNEVISNVGLGSTEREFDKVLQAVTREPGVARSVLMQRYHLTARTADFIFSTLEQRGMIDRMKAGATERLFPFGGKARQTPKGVPTK